MKKATSISSSCQLCGKPIPALPIADAFCVGCRYQPQPTTKGKSAYEVASENCSVEVPWPPEDHDEEKCLSEDQLAAIRAELIREVSAVVLPSIADFIWRDQTPAEMSQTAVLLAAELKRPGAPTGLGELATCLKVSRPTACRLRKRFNQRFNETLNRRLFGQKCRFLTNGETRGPILETEKS